MLHDPSAGTASGAPLHCVSEKRVTVPVQSPVTVQAQAAQSNEVSVPTRCLAVSGPLGHATSPGAVMHPVYGPAGVAVQTMPLQPAGGGAELGVQVRSRAAYVRLPRAAAPGDAHAPPLGPEGTYSRSKSL